ncbi:MAG: iron ABC transporter permease [Cyclobacteriaceae bacterium]|nr:iron ABC transporter permease [Cyclobacteriaceae bacterium]
MRWWLLFLLIVLLLIVHLHWGSVFIPPKQILTIISGGRADNPAWRDLILFYRLPKALTALLAGSALSLSGLLMQTFFRNPLAGPDVLGLTSGASLFVALLVMAGSILPIPEGTASVLIAAFSGCAAVFLLMTGVAHYLKDSSSLLITGLMVGAVVSAIVSVLHFISRAELLQYFFVWSMGSLGHLNFTELVWLGVCILTGGLLALSLTKATNAWLLGENYAQSMGVAVNRTRLLIIICASLLTGAVTAFCGPVAFIGIAVPHITRLVFNTSNHKVLIPGVLLTGAALLLLCDLIAQLPGSARVLPINVVTALIGGPVVIWIILRSKKTWV